MTLHKTGIANSTKGVSTINPSFDFQSQLNNIKSQIVAARVIDIVLDENHPLFQSVGQWNGIGAIFYEFVNQSATSTAVNFALPYDSQNKTYPLVNEIVLLFSLPNQQMGMNSSNQSYFYLKPLGIWNHPHHDAYPNLTVPLKSSQANDYKSSSNGVVRRVEDQSTEIDLNSPVNPSQNTFVEKNNIHPLMPYMGDSLIEGRYGQSIRLGSTAKSQSEIKNNWSTSGENGDPLLILRNGQPTNVNDKGWIPITEDISKDLSSIYLSSYQKIPIGISNENFISYNIPPIKPSQFKLPQIIANSERIILNAKTDSILISAQKSIGLSSNESVNIESKQVYIAGNDIKLGSKDATQPVLKGDDTVTLLKQLVTEVRNISKALETSQIFPNGVPTPNIAVQSTTQLSTKNLNNILSILEDNINGIKSNFVKVN